MLGSWHLGQPSRTSCRYKLLLAKLGPACVLPGDVDMFANMLTTVILNAAADAFLASYGAV